MKILLVHDYGTLDGGAEVMTFALRDELRAQGHSVSVFTSNARTPGAILQADYFCKGTLSRFRTLLQVWNPWAYLRLRCVMRDFQPDIVHVRMFLTQLSPAILPLLHRVPALYHVVWYRPICPTGTKLLPTGAQCQESAGPICYRQGCLPLSDWLLLQCQLWLWRRWRPAFRRIVANSRAVQRCLIEEGFGSVGMVSNGVAPCASTRLLSSRPVVGFAGRLVAEKGVDVLLRAFAAVVHMLPEAHLIVIGDGSDRQKLEGLSRMLNITKHVSFLGHLPQKEMEAGLATAWVQVVPSRWAEPFGLVAAEAMMRGTAVIASETGGLVDIVEQGVTGYLVPPGDVDLMTEKLLELLRNRVKAEAMGEAGRKRAEVRLSVTRQCNEFLNIYRDMAQKTDRAPADWEHDVIESEKESVV